MNRSTDMLSEQSDIINKALQVLDCDNSFYGFSSRVDCAYERILEEAMGDVAYNDLMYWLYDSKSYPSGERRARITYGDGRTVEYTEFKKYYDEVICR